MAVMRLFIYTPPINVPQKKKKKNNDGYFSWTQILCVFKLILRCVGMRLLRTARMDYKCHKTWNICIQKEHMSLKECGRARSCVVVVEKLHGGRHRVNSSWGKFRKLQSVA